MDWALLAPLDESERRTVLSLARRRRFARGEIVFHEGDPGDVLHLVEKGHVALRATTPLGDVAMLRVLGPGAYFGEFAVLSPGPRSATAVALDAVETRCLSDGALADLRAHDAAVDRVLMEALIVEVRRLSAALVEALYVPVNKRLLRRLVELGELFDRGSAPVSIPLTQEELAQLAGTTRPTANRVLRSLEEEGIVLIERGRIAIVDPSGLARRAR